MRLSRLVSVPLLVCQAVGGGAVALAHARDVATAPAAFESRHDARCPVLHDALRCALCHYAGAQVVGQQGIVTAPPQPELTSAPPARRVAVADTAVHSPVSPRAPPLFS